MLMILNLYLFTSRRPSSAIVAYHAIVYKEAKTSKFVDIIVYYSYQVKIQLP